MKINYFILLSSLLLFTFSCSTSTDSPIPDDADGASIIVQAKHYEVSDIIRNVDTNWEAVYKYKPRPGFIGTDYVELELSTGSDGTTPPTKIEIVKLKFIVQ